MKSVGVFVQQSNDKVFSLCWESDLGGNSSSKTWYAQALQALSFIVCISAQVITIHTLKYSRCVKKQKAVTRTWNYPLYGQEDRFLSDLTVAPLLRDSGAVAAANRTAIEHTSNIIVANVASGEMRQRRKERGVRTT